MGERPKAQPAEHETEKPNINTDQIGRNYDTVNTFLDRDLQKLGFNEEEEYLLKETAMYLSEDIANMALPAMDTANKTLQMKELHSELYKWQQDLLGAIALFDTFQTDTYPKFVQIFHKYLNVRKTYQELVDSTLHPEQEQQILDEEQGAQLFEALNLPPDTKAHWAGLITEAQSEIPTPETAKGEMDDRRQAFLDLGYNNVLTLKKGLLSTLAEVSNSLQEGFKMDDEMRTIVLAGTNSFLKLKKQYLFNLQNEISNSAKWAAFASMTAQEGAEEGIEHIIDVMPILKYGSAQIKLGKGMLGVKLKLAQHGIQTSMLQEMLAGNGPAQRILRESIKTLTPNGVGSLLTYMYYLYISEDKTKAMLMYSSFLVAGRGMDGLGCVVNKYFAPANRLILEKMLRIKPKLAKRLFKIGKKLPIALKFGMLMVLAYGGGEDLNNALETMERYADPLAYDIAGNVIGALQSPFDIAQAYGLAGANPLTEQKLFLDWQPALAQDTILTAATGKQRMEWWDELVEEYAKEEENPIQQQLMRLESIKKGPGGKEAWKRRKALDFYTLWKRLQNSEANINEQLQQLGVKSSGVKLSKVLYDVAQNEEESSYGNRNIRNAITSIKKPYKLMYSKIDAAIKSTKDAEKKEELKELKMMYGHYESSAKQLDQDRSLYVRLEIFSPSWLEERDQDGSELPTIVERGLYDEMRYQSKRREALSANMNGQTLAECLKMESPSSFTLDPTGWMAHVVEKLDIWNNIKSAGKGKDFVREWVDEKMFHKGFAQMSDLIAQSIKERLGEEKGKLEYKRVFRPLQEAILQHRTQGAIDARTAMELLSAAYTEHYDGKLRQSRDKEFKKGNDKTFVYGSANPERIYIDESDYDSQVTNPASVPDVPMIVHCEELGHGRTMSNKPQATITTVMYFVYDKKADKWNVKTMTYTISTVDYLAESYGHDEVIGRKTHNAQSKTVIEEPFRLWRAKHPKFAVQMFDTMKQHKQQLIESEEKIKTLQKAEKERILSGQEQAIENAKQNPETWQSYGAERYGNYYEYVAYDPDNKAFVYLSTPKLDKRTYVTTPGAVTPSMEAETGVRVEPLGDKFHFKWSALRGNFVKVMEDKFDPKFPRIIRNALVFPHQSKESFDPAESARTTLLTILATYANGKTLKEKEWTDLIDETVGAASQLKTPERSQQFFGRLRNEINGETLENGKDHSYLNTDMYRRALTKTRNALHLAS